MLSSPLLEEGAPAKEQSPMREASDVLVGSWNEAEATRGGEECRKERDLWTDRVDGA